MSDSQFLPAGGIIDWTVGLTTGIRGGIPTNRTQSGATIAAGATSATINSRIASAASNTIVQLGPGAFSIADIELKSDVTLRGSGPSTVLSCTSSGLMLAMRGNGAVSAQGSITAGYVKGSTVITVSGTPAISTGDFIGVTQDDESWCFTPEPGVQHIYAMHRVENAVGNVLTLWPPLTYGSTGFNPKYEKMTGGIIQNAGIENMTLNSLNVDNSYVIAISSAYSCWVKDVIINNTPGTSIYGFQTLGIEINHVDCLGCVSVPDGYGIQIDNATKGNTAWAGYNCIFDGFYHSILTSGQVGCAFGYNYTVNESARSGVATQTAGFNVTHNAQGMMTLWEGNYGNSLTADQIHGGAAYQTVRGNRFHCVDNFFNKAKTAAIYPDQGSRYWNFVGNTLGDPLGGATWPSGTTSFYKYKWTGPEWLAASASDNGGMYRLGFVSGSTLDATVASTATFYKNFDYHNNSIQDNGAFAISDSLMFTSKPSWFGNLAWPPYDPAAPIASGPAAASRIPAGYRYVNGADPTQGVFRLGFRLHTV